MEIANRKTHLDILRILANFLVIFNHTIGFALYQDPAGGILKNSIYMVLSIITKINVPLFFMISGALLLGKEEEISQILKKRVLRFFLLLVCASSFLLILKFPHLVTPYKLIYNVFTCYIDHSYWYLYAHIGFLLLLPYIRKIVCHFTHKDFRYFLILNIIVQTIFPILFYTVNIYTTEPLSLYKELQIPLITTSAFFYPIIGYYLEHHVDIDSFSFKTFIQLFAVSGFGIFITELLTFYQNTNILTEDFFHLFDYMLAITAFLFFKYIIQKKDILKFIPYSVKIIRFVSSLTLGIYILDPYWKYYISPYVFKLLSPPIPTMVTSFIYCIISMLLGGITTYILKKLPFFKKIL